MTRNEAIELIRKEINEAVGQYGHFNSPHEGYAVIKEELEELWDDIKDKHPEGFKEEAVQVAAMAIQFLIDFVE